MRVLFAGALPLIAALLLAACASTEPTTDTAQQPPSEPMLADDIWWDGLEGEEVYQTAETMPGPVGGMTALVESVRHRIRGLGCVNDHTAILIEVLVTAEGNLIDTRIPSETKNDACENLSRLAAFDLEWTPGIIDGKPVHMTVAYGFPIEFLYE